MEVRWESLEQERGYQTLIITFLAKEVIMKKRKDFVTKNTRQIGAGIDCHKDQLECCVRKMLSGCITYKWLSDVPTDPASVKELAVKLKSLGCLEVCMEETGRYTDPVAIILLQNGINVAVCNPIQFKHQRGQKDDRRDAQRIADAFCLGNTKGSFRVFGFEKEVRILLRRLSKIVSDTTLFHNRLNAELVSMNIRLDKCPSGSSKTKLELVKLLIKEKRPLTADEIYENTRAMKTTSEEYAKVVTNAVFSDSQNIAVTQLIQLIEFLEKQKEEIYTELVKYKEIFKEEMKILQSMPGVSERFALTVIGEVGTNMERFTGANQLTSLIGLAPTQTASAGKNKCAKISHAGRFIKPLLMEECWLLTQGIHTTNAYYAKIFEKLKVRMDNKKALVVIARKVMVAFYHMLLKHECFNPINYEKILRGKKDKTFNKKLPIDSTKFIYKKTDEVPDDETLLEILASSGIVLRTNALENI
jgi:transposase